MLQDRRLSYTARGLLADLLSRPQGWQEGVRQMADSSIQGRRAVEKALRELTEFGYYRVDKVRCRDGKLVSQAHLYDTPWPSRAMRGQGRNGEPEPGDAAPGLPVSQPWEDRERKTPTPPAPAAGEAGARKLTASRGSAAAQEAVAVLYRVIRRDARLAGRFDAATALDLAPLVEQWLERVGEDGLAQGLLQGLPEEVLSPFGLIKDRLRRKLPPPEYAADAAPAPRWFECAECADPVPEPGICRVCARLDPRAGSDRAQRPPGVCAGSAVTARGMALVRAALSGSAVACPGG
ncbi:hypothetical protein [Streptacidiphilus rugosus]|uniref:hypothetical protein n=1 Tax=Streptacidiphilus rugosus TaxID=405783 RepID=UPI001E35408A|nr:hypothetical protein [Streptacidiphilus rugosus]